MASSYSHEEPSATQVKKTSLCMDLHKSAYTTKKHSEIMLQDPQNPKAAILNLKPFPAVILNH